MNGLPSGQCVSDCECDGAHCELQNRKKTAERERETRRSNDGNKVSDADAPSISHFPATLFPSFSFN